MLIASSWLKPTSSIRHLPRSSTRPMSRRRRKEISIDSRRCHWMIELAPGIDLDTQVLALMDFRPIIGELRPMPLHAPGAWRAP